MAELILWGIKLSSSDRGSREALRWHLAASGSSDLHAIGNVFDSALIKRQGCAWHRNTNAPQSDAEL
jgi:hypothetical protein